MDQKLKESKLGSKERPVDRTKEKRVKWEKAKELITVLLMMQISLGGLYFSLSALGIFILNTDRKPQTKASLPDVLTILLNLIEGAVMVLIGVLIQYANHNGKPTLLCLGAFLNGVLLVFNTTELGLMYYKRYAEDHNLEAQKRFQRDIAGCVLLWIFEVTYYVIYIYALCNLIIRQRAVPGAVKSRSVEKPTESKKDKKEKPMKSIIFRPKDSQKSSVKPEIKAKPLK